MDRTEATDLLRRFEEAARQCERMGWEEYRTVALGALSVQIIGAMVGKEERSVAGPVVKRDFSGSSNTALLGEYRSLLRPLATDTVKDQLAREAIWDEIMRRMDAKPAELRWTSAIPTEPGYYFVTSDEPQFIRKSVSIWEIAFRRTMAGEEMLFRLPGNESFSTVVALCYLFYGPLQHPSLEKGGEK